jgi:hypothetical protein
MLAAKLNEMEDNMDEYAYEDGEEMEEGFASSHEENADANLDFNLEEDEDLEEDFDLSEILAELEDEDDSLEEAKKDEKKKKMKMMNEADDEEEEEEDSIADMTIDDLKALIADVVAQEMGDEEGEEAEEEEMEMGGEEESDEINLDELLAELDAMDEAKEDKVEENILRKMGSAITGAITGASYKDVEACKKEGKGKDQALVACVNEKRAERGEKPLSLVSSSGGALGSSGFRGGAATAEGKKAEKELNEAIRTINTLRRELNEVNLLNAKLLYVNKIFKAKNLSESQKLQVIASFDKATTAKEAKVVFESLNATLTTAAPKQAIKESLGFASKAAGVAPRKAIVESNDVITRMQKLANIIK